MKQIAAIPLTLLLGCFLAGCGDTQAKMSKDDIDRLKNPSSEGPPPEAAEAMKSGKVVPYGKNPDGSSAK